MTPYEIAQNTFDEFMKRTESLGDEDYLNACDELASMAEMAATAKREEMGEE